MEIQQVRYFVALAKTLNFTRAICLAIVRGRPHSPAVGVIVQEARRYPWPASHLAPSATENILLSQQVMAVCIEPMSKRDFSRRPRTATIRVTRKGETQ